jgi:GNAT superfamily N-acetyltransferase
MTGSPLVLRRASASGHDLETIVRLIEDAADWLRATKDTDQWDQPWPDQAGRDSRILTDLHRARTWICWDGATPAATITIDRDHNPYWPERWRKDPAVHVHRLVVDRPYAGVGLGAELLDWAGRTSRRYHGAAWLRVNAWTTNLRLHAYYERQGFALCGLSADHGYPSAAMFHKPTDRILGTGRGLFIEASAEG